jgi:hypothetical protein
MNENTQEIFNDFLEELFYEQFGADLASTDPDEYQRMFEQFADDYGMLVLG